MNPTSSGGPTDDAGASGAGTRRGARRGLTPGACMLLASVGCILLGASHRWISGLPAQREFYGASVTGSFVRKMGGQAEPDRGLPFWVSDAQGGPGSVAIGPFPAPDHLKFSVRGDPGANPGAVYLELEVTKDRIPIPVAGTGPGWRTVGYSLPLGWRGRLIMLHADLAQAGTGGFAITQPFGRGTGGTRSYGLMETVTAWLANGLLYGAVFLAIARAIARRQLVRPCWVPLLASAVLAAIGYAAFWAYFASPALGKLLSGCIFLAAALANAMDRGRFDAGDHEWLAAVSAAALIGLLYIGIFHLFHAQRDFYDLASNRFLVGMPGDNRLPFDFAGQLYQGQRPRELGAGWLSSDRPPLQEGWQLIGWPVTAALGFSDQSASATASVWLQLSWVFALYGLLRSLRMPSGRALLWIAAASMNGFFLFHTLFTWPKLSAAAFVCGTFGMWVLAGCDPGTRAYLLGALFAALACLAHGGAAFSLLPFIAWVAWRSATKGEAARWVLAAAAFALLVAPWLAYQHFYAPPGNRLIKWHLANHPQADSMPTLQAVREAYRDLTWGQILDGKLENAAFQFGGNGSDAAETAANAADAGRTTEYLHAFRALGWWNMAVPLFIVSMFNMAYRRRAAEICRQQWVLGVWIILSLAAWCLLMFTQTEIAQGSLAVLVAVFALCACWFDLVRGWWLPCVALLQGVSLANTWMPGNAVTNGPVSGCAVALILAAAGSAAAWIFLSRRGGPGTGAAPGHVTAG